MSIKRFLPIEQSVHYVHVCLFVCLYVCLSTRISQKPRPNFTKFSVHALLVAVAVARSSFNDGVSLKCITYLCYAFPVLWMTSFSRNGANRPELKTTCMFHRIRQVAASTARLLSSIADLFVLTLSRSSTKVKVTEGKCC